MKRLTFKGSSDLHQRDYSNIDRISQNRSISFAWLLLIPFLFLIAQLWRLQIASGDQFLKAAQFNLTRTQRINAPRGLIEDSDGLTLAVNRPSFAIYALPIIAKKTTVVNRLALILDMKPGDIMQILRTERKNAYSPVRIAIDISDRQLARIEEERPYLPGVATAPEAVRAYPYGKLLGGVLGSLGRIDAASYRKKRDFGYFPDDYVGVTGLEAQYESLLHGAPGGSLADQKTKTESETLGLADPTPGKTLKLSIQTNVQAAAERTMAEHNWTGAAVAVDVETGAIIAMATAPTFDPNLFVRGISTKNWNSLVENRRKPLLNRAVDCLYPPGSTFKQITAAAALESKAVDLNTTWRCDGSMKLGSRRFDCWAVHGPTSFYKAIADSCDVYFYNAGLRTGPDKIAAVASEYPLARLTGIDLPHEMIGTIPSPAWKAKRFEKEGGNAAKWFDGDTLNMSIGQGFVLTTPLQMALATAATASGGVIYKPFLLDSVIDPISGKVILKTIPTVENRLSVSQETLEAVRIGMRQCVTDGTGKIVNFRTLEVAAKTGSAQTTGRAPTHGWFVAFAPYSHPKIAISAIVEYGGHGASSAGLVAEAMLRAYFKLPDSDKGRTAKGD